MSAALAIERSCEATSAIHERIRAQLQRRPCTLLGIGPVSRTTVKAAVALANEHSVDLMLIPSRRQVDSDEFGAGYVNGWDSHRFADDVRAQDAGGHVLLCRDHGGPWQNSVELAAELSPEEAMKSAKRSYREDIEAGFDILHIDPSVSPQGEPSQDVALKRLFELYGYCIETARAVGREVAIEVGTEEQDSMSRSMQGFFETLHQIVEFCDARGLPRPTFVVAQTGTKVMEARNVGLLDSPYRIDGAVPTETLIPRLMRGLKRDGVFLKQHNTDYLSDEALAWHPLLGIHAANVAPEFGVAESRAFLHVLEGTQLTAHRDRFVEIAHGCGKWKKWMLPDTRATDRDRAIIAGHYVFSTPEFLALKAEAARDLARMNIELDAYLLARVREAIFRYMKAFRLVGAP